jgi:predicted HTH domain antitoxin
MAGVANMPILTISDDRLKEAELTEDEALVEFACRLFDAGKLTLWSAAKLARLDRGAMEDALLERGISVYRPTPSDLVEDLATLDRLGT